MKNFFIHIFLDFKIFVFETIEFGDKYSQFEKSSNMVKLPISVLFPFLKAKFDHKSMNFTEIYEFLKKNISNKSIFSVALIITDTYLHRMRRNVNK